MPIPTILRRGILLILATMLGLSGVSGVAAAPPALRQSGMSGTIGNHPIAMIATIEGESRLRKIHYSYASQGKPIPLTATIAGSAVTLREPGGGVFELRFVTTDPTAPQPLTFYTSTGLRGIWRKGGRRLPVRLSMDVSGQTITDCSLYPPPPAPKGPHFPERGCEHIPDKAALDACVARPFTSNDAIDTCIGTAMRTCRDDQYNLNFCAMNIESYLGQIIDLRLRRGLARSLTVEGYPRWSKRVIANCKANSGYGPDGSGYGADISLCSAAERLRLLQNGLRTATRPIRTHPPVH